MPDRVLRPAVKALLTVALSGVAMTSCSGPSPSGQPGPAPKGTASAARRAAAALPYLPAPARLTGFDGVLAAPWLPAGRRVRGRPAIWETALVPPGGTRKADIAWMDTRLLRATLYSGSLSPGGVGFRYTAPVGRAQARTLVAAFNGGFLMKDAHGGYYTEGKMVVRLRPGAASLVIYKDGSTDVGIWGSDLKMTGDVASVRQNLVLLVAGGQPTAQARTARWLHVWGNTCGIDSCAHTAPGVEHQWRSGLGVTADGALVYVNGPDLSPLQLAELFSLAGAVRAMELDINPNWPVFVSYAPPPGAPAAPGNGSKLGPSKQGPETFFRPQWARDFVTMSAR